MIDDFKDQLLSDEEKQPSTVIISKKAVQAAKKIEKKKQKIQPLEPTHGQKVLLSEIKILLPEEGCERLSNILKEIGDSLMYGMSMEDSLEMAFLVAEVEDVKEIKKYLAVKKTTTPDRELYDKVKAFVRLSEMSYKKRIMSSAVMNSATDNRILKGLMDLEVKKQEAKEKESAGKGEKTKSAEDVLKEFYKNMQDNPTPINRKGNEKNK